MVGDMAIWALQSRWKITREGCMRFPIAGTCVPATGAACMPALLPALLPTEHHNCHYYFEGVLCNFQTAQLLPSMLLRIACKQAPAGLMCTCKTDLEQSKT